MYVLYLRLCINWIGSVDSFLYGYDNEACFDSTKQADGLDNGVIPFPSAIINGKGKVKPELYNQIVAKVCICVICECNLAYCFIKVLYLELKPLNSKNFCSYTSPFK